MAALFVAAGRKLGLQTVLRPAVELLLQINFQKIKILKIFLLKGVQILKIFWKKNSETITEKILL